MRHVMWFTVAAVTWVMRVLGGAQCGLGNSYVTVSHHRSRNPLNP